MKLRYAMGEKTETPSQNFQIGLLLCGEICDCKTQSKYGNIKRLEAAMISDIRECIKPISYVKSNAADMMNFVNDRKEPLIITQNGESRAVLIDIESYQEMKKAFSLLKLIQFSEMDVKSGKAKSAEDVFSNLKRKYNLGN